MDIKYTLVQNVRALRKSKGLSQAAFAEGIDASHSHIRQVEAGQSGYSLEMLERIATFFEIEISDLFKGPDQIKKALSSRELIEILSSKLGVVVEIKDIKTTPTESDLHKKISSLGNRELELLNRTVDKMIAASSDKRKAN